MEARSWRGPRRTSGRTSILVAVVIAWNSGPAAADSINLTTSGTVAGTTQPTQTFFGVTDRPTDTTGTMYLGYITVGPPPPPDGTDGLLPGSFDITLGPGQGLPSLEVKGSFLIADPISGNSRLHFGLTGLVDSVSSSDPSLNGLLPPQLANLMADPANLQIYPGSWGTGSATVPIYGSFEQIVPEPGSAVCMLTILGGFLAIRRKSGRARAVAIGGVTACA